MNDDIKKIAEDFNKTILERVNDLLEMDANNYTNLGSDSTKTEILDVKKKSRIIYRAIKDIDVETGKLLMHHQDGY